MIDDGSTDDSAALAASFADRGVILQRQTNRGQSAACNVALQMARGDFIKFFDADDVLSPEMLASQVQALRLKPGAIAYGEWARFHHAPHEADFLSRPAWHDAAPVDWLVEAWQDAQPMMQCGLYLVPREILQQSGGWDERLSLINDFEFFTRVTLASRGIVFTPAARLYYRSGVPGSLSARKSATAWESAFLSVTTGVSHLLRVEDSPRTRRVGAAVLQGLVYDMYPNTPGLVKKLEQQIAELGSAGLPPHGGRGFQVARRVVGWKAARWLQVWTGKFPRPART